MATIEETAAGISFALSDEQQALRELARDFAEKEIRPKAAEYDEHATHPADVIAKAHEVGLMNLHVPEEYGGRAPALPGDARWRGALLGLRRHRRLDRVQHPRRLPGDGCGNGRAEARMADAAPRRAAPLLVRPVPSPTRAPTSRASSRRPSGEGDEYVLNGSKTFITNAGRAAWTVVFAKTDPTKGHRGLSAFVVPMDAEGVTVEKHLDKMGQRATDTSAFSLQDVVVPAENRLGKEGDGFKIAMQTLDFTRPGTAAGAVGVAQAAYELAVDYAKERVTFDVPIAMHQGVNFLIADMATDIEAARLLTWQAAWLSDQG